MNSRKSLVVAKKEKKSAVGTRQTLCEGRQVARRWGAPDGVKEKLGQNGKGTLEAKGGGKKKNLSG